ncbi:ATP-binding protein [Nonomuraea sp. NPDC049158]|uniref:ATP-binding protein n=1 Tax=Nonomuraea sp. NPDC049158 TaxID=3155649 RepID=UPI0033DD7505
MARSQPPPPQAPARRTPSPQRPAPQTPTAQTPAPPAPQTQWLWPAALALPVVAACCAFAALLLDSRTGVVWACVGAAALSLLGLAAVAALRQAHQEAVRTMSRRESAMHQREAEFQHHLQQRNTQWSKHVAARSKALQEAVRHLVDKRIPAVIAQDAVPPPYQSQGLDEDAAELLEEVLDAVGAAAERDRERQESLRLALLALARRVQTSAHRIQENVSVMAERHPHNPDVLETSMQVDHAAAQQGRHAQSLAVLCGEWPGQQWPNPLALVDVVRAASSRIVAYKRVEVSGDPDTAVAAHVVEPLIHLVAELLANATQSSPPATTVLVAVRNVQRGAVIEIDDGGVGMDDHHLEQAREIVSGRRSVDVGEVGEIPQTGLAVIGHYVRRHGFLADLMPSPYGGVRAVVLVPGPVVETLEPAEAPPRARPARHEGRPIDQAQDHPTLDEPVPDEPVLDAPAPLGEHVAGTVEDTAGGGALPRRRSRRGETGSDAERLAAAGPAAEPPATPEQAGEWMAAFFDHDPDAGENHER